MNGVRRFLINPNIPSTSTSTPPTKDRSSISSRSSSPNKELPPPPPLTPVTKALFIRKDRKPPPLVSDTEPDPFTTSAPSTSTAPQHRKPPPPEVQETPLPPSQLQTNGVQQPNTRDALLLSLLSSEAIVESRGYEILSAEEVEELKKVRAIRSINI
jgi:Up-regulated During Septation